MNKNKCILRCFSIFLFISTFIALWAPVFAKTPLVLDNTGEKFTLGIHTEFLEDKTKQLSIYDVISPGLSKNFVSSQQNVLNFGFSSSAYWVRFELDDQTSKSWLLEIDYPLLDSIKLYAAEGLNIVAFKEEGRLQPFYSREIIDRNFVFKLPGGGKKTYYIRCESESPMKLPLNLWTERAFESKTHNEQMVFGVYYGILLVMILYNLFLFLSLRDKSYLYYVVYITGYLLTQMNLLGASYEYLWPSLVWWNARSHTFFIAFSLFWGLKFSTEFLSAKVYTPMLHRLINYTAVLSVLGMGIALVIGTTPLFTPALSLLQLFASPLVILTGVLVWRRGYRYARYFLVGWVILVCSFILNISTTWKNMPVNFFTQYGMQIASVFEVILFSLALADRINSIRQDKESEENRRIFAEKLRDITKYMSSTLELTEVMGRFLESIAEVVPYDSALALLRENGRFKVLATGGAFPGWKRDVSDGIENCKVLLEIIERKTPLLTEDIEKINDFGDYWDTAEVCSWLVIPAIYRKRVSGVVILQSQNIHAFSDHEKGIVFTLAGQVSVAIENAYLFKKLNSKTVAMQNLLNNAKQGFLSFGEDLVIHEEYSSECLEIFGEKIENKRFPEILCGEDAVQKEFLEKLLVNILLEKNESKRDAYFSLLPKETVIGEKSVEIDYKLIGSSEGRHAEEVMVILTDVTEKRLLKDQMEKEKNNLKMVVKVVADYNGFMACIKDYQNFYQTKVHELLQSKRLLEDIISEIFRNVHTLKGNFSLLGMVHIVEKLHEFETGISNIGRNLEGKTREDIKRFLEQCDMEQWLEEDLATLKEKLGDSFFRGENVITIDELQLVELERKALSVLSPYECKMLLPDIRKLRYKPFRELLKSYPEYIMQLSERMGKRIHPVVMQGGDFLVDTEKYSSFCKALGHVFRNVIDHGIESAEERKESRKEEFGNITCSMSLIGDRISIVISDDGCGIDAEKIRSRTVEKGIYDWETAYKIPDDKIIDMIFRDGFSMKDDVTEVSGRGVGLAAVKKEVDRMGGTIETETQAGVGTSFAFMLPFDDMTELFDISVSDVMNPLLEITKTFFSKLLGETLTVLNDYTISREETMQMRRFTTFTVIKGVLEGRFVMNFDEKLAKDIVRSFVNDKLTPQEEEIYIADALSECSNIVLGNAIKMFPGLEELVIMEAPVTIGSEDDAPKSFQQSDIWTCNVIFNSGKLSLSFVTLEMLKDDFPENEV